MKKQYRKLDGFTLVEMLLVMVIISMIIYLGIGYIQQRTLSLRIDRTSSQMQQILNAALSYYVANGAWPANLAALIPTYLPLTISTSPWTTTYQVTSTSAAFYVAVQMPAMNSAPTIANVIAGTLPLAYTNTTFTTTAPAANACNTSGGCYIVSMVNIPGANLNNVGVVNFVNLYHSGSCCSCPQVALLMQMGIKQRHKSL